MNRDYVKLTEPGAIPVSGSIYKGTMTMGCDIHGWVEIKPMETLNYWRSVLNVGALVVRNYDIFGSLFGVRNHVGFEPIAADRGLPEKVSELCQKESDRWGVDGHSHTWISAIELWGIDWNEESTKVDDRIHVYKLTPEGERETPDEFTKFLWGSELDDYQEELAKHGQVQIDNMLYIYEKVCRRDAIGKDWKLLLDFIKKLAEAYGSDNVRMVVWFDN